MEKTDTLISWCMVDKYISLEILISAICWWTCLVVHCHTSPSTEHSGRFLADDLGTGSWCHSHVDWFSGIIK